MPTYLIWDSYPFRAVFPKMACIFSESSNGDGTCNIFPRLDVLTHLESLRITYYGRYPQTAEFSFPFSVKKLTLSNFCLPWKHISVIGRLPNLQVQKLLFRSVMEKYGTW